MSLGKSDTSVKPSDVAQHKVIPLYSSSPGGQDTNKCNICDNLSESKFYSGLVQTLA